MTAWVYILECSDGSLYVGSTTDLERRVASHNLGDIAGYTRSRRPVRLVFSQQTESQLEAYRWERQIKGWRRSKKLALIRGDYGALPQLARNRQGGTEW